MNINLLKTNSHKLSRLRETILSYKGSIPCHIVFENENGRARLPLGEGFFVNPVPQLAAKINQIFNENSVKFIVDGRLEDGEKL